MLTFQDLFIFICGFLIGSIPFGYIFSKLKGIDIRKVGSGNIGATNVTRVLGIKIGAIVALLDVIKGLVFALFISKIYASTDWKLFFLCFAPVLGHVFTPWLGFKGGKGVGTLTGVLIIIFNWQTLLFALVVWIILLYMTKIMSLTNLILSVILPILFLLNFHNLISVFFGILFGLFIFWTHRSNIKRLIAGKELKLNQKSKIKN